MKEPNSKAAIVIYFALSIPCMIAGFCIGFTTRNDTVRLVLWFLMMVGCVMFYIAVKSAIRLSKLEHEEKRCAVASRAMGHKTPVSEAEIAKSLGFENGKLPTTPEEFQKMRDETARLMKQQEDKIRAIRDGFQEIYAPDIDYFPNDDKTNNNTPFGSITAGREIADALIEKLKTEDGIPFEMLFAYLGAMAGRECSEGLIQSLKKLIPSPELRESIAGILDIMIVRTTSDELFLMGDKVGDTFFSYYKKVLKEPDLRIDVLLPLAKKTAGVVGSGQYWNTEYDNQVNVNLRELANTACDREFEEPLRQHCNAPSERLMAYEYATHIALNKVVMAESSDIHGNPKTIAADILAEYGWRASHYIWNWN